jgi:hypothetical protein
MSCKSANDGVGAEYVEDMSTVEDVSTAGGVYAGGEKSDDISNAGGMYGAV